MLSESHVTEKTMRSIRLRLLALAGFILTFGSARLQLFAQSLSTQSAMHARVISLYNFSPSKVTADMRESKSKEMDAFWNEVKTHKETELPLLRIELENSGNPKFFFADGSGLLSSISQSPEDQKIAASCLARVDLSDFQSRQYLYEVHALALKGTDITQAALHMLDDPKFQVFLPEHGAYRLDQSACLLFALLPLPNDVWLQAVIERMKTERDETATKSILLLLFYAQTDEADRIISSVAKQAESAAAVKELASSIMKHERDLGLGSHPSKDIEAKLRKQRQARVAGISDEAVDDLDDLTGEIARARSLSASEK
jgi:hypothetical protein